MRPSEKILATPLMIMPRSLSVKTSEIHPPKTIRNMSVARSISIAQTDEEYEAADNLLVLLICIYGSVLRERDNL